VRKRDAARTTKSSQPRRPASKISAGPVSSTPIESMTWRPEVAYAAANMAVEVSDRLVGALVLLDHIQSPAPHLPTDDGGYVIGTLRDLIEDCQRDLRKVVAANDVQAAGGAR
jgi:hypothetical protein